MNDELKTKMLEYLQQFENQIKEAGEFAKSEVPLVVQEYLQWQILSNLATALMFIAGAIFIQIFFGRLIERLVQEEEKTPARIFLGAVVLMLFIFAMPPAHSAAKAHVAPRVVILEKIGELVK